MRFKMRMSVAKRRLVDIRCAILTVMRNLYRLTHRADEIAEYVVKDFQGGGGRILKK